MSESKHGGEALAPTDYETLFDHASDGIFIHPPDSPEILAVNERLTELLGYTREELCRMTVPEITADDWEPPVQPVERIRQAREEGQVKFEWRDQHRDGTAFWVEVNLTLVTLSAGERVVASVRRIDERKRKERRIRAIFDQTYQFTGLMEPDGTLLEANRTALEFGDLDREDVVGKPVWECYWFEYSTDVQERAREAVRRAAEGEFVRHNLEVRGSEGTEVIDFSIRPVTDGGGEVALLIPEGRVITERLEQRERLTAYNRIMRHNLRNQLTTINGYANEIEAQTDDPRIADLADRMLDAGERLDRLAEQIREFDRLREGDLLVREVDLGELLSGLGAEHGAGADGTAIRTAVEGAVTVRSDPRLVRLVLGHLVENAVEHGGSTVRLLAAPADQEAGVEVTVRDDGPGIPPSEYEPVVSGSSDPLEHATSIGLLIARWGANDLGGELRFESGEGRGTEVTLWLPDEI